MAEQMTSRSVVHVGTLTRELVELCAIAVSPTDLVIRAAEDAMSILSTSNSLFERAQAERILATVRQASLCRVGHC